MAAQPKEYFDIKTAAKKDTYLIDKNSLAPEVLANRFKKFSGVEKVFYLSLVFAALVMAIGLLFIQTKTYEVENRTVQLNAENTVLSEKNTEYNQQISDMTSNGTLSNSAISAGMTRNYNDVLKATK